MGTLAVCVALAVVIVTCYGTVLARLVHQWAGNPDYSHGFVVPLFAAYILWNRRGLLTPEPRPGLWMAVLMFLAAAGIRAAGIVQQYPLMEPASLLPCLAGVAFLVGGWSYFRWSWPSILFLAFAIPLPGAISMRMAGPLQTIATAGSTYVLQTLGISAAASGNVIYLSSGQIGVVEACNGLRMLVAFLAIAFAITLMLKVPVWERGFVLLSGVAVAIVCNIFRIAATGVVYEMISPELAERIFHDFAGWLMMPLATGLLILEIQLLSHIFPQSHHIAGPLLVQRARDRAQVSAQPRCAAAE